jgi:hypothetical protein
LGLFLSLAILFTFINLISAVGTASLLGLVVACSCLYKSNFDFQSNQGRPILKIKFRFFLWTARSESRRLVASALPSESTLADAMNNATNTWNKTHKSGSTMADRSSSKRSSTYELQSMADKMSSKNLMAVSN